jgi:hypothetical protein
MPAASSLALLTRRPLDKRCNEVAISPWVLARARCENSDITLVLIAKAMGNPLLIYVALIVRNGNLISWIQFLGKVDIGKLPAYFNGIDDYFEKLPEIGLINVS